jgi:hypothetical protein
MYNSLLSSTSLNGKAFFYENPLEIALEELNREQSKDPKDRERLPIRQRLEVFGCSCCPPNINRFFAELGDLICFDGDHAMIEQYISGTVNSTFGQIKIAEAYATKGTATVSSKDYKADKISLRLPAWTNNYTVKLNGKSVSEKPVDGYLTLAVPAAFEIELCFEIKPRFIRPLGAVIEDAKDFFGDFVAVCFCAYFLKMDGQAHYVAAEGAGVQEILTAEAVFVNLFGGAVFQPVGEVYALGERRGNDFIMRHGWLPPFEFVYGIIA